MAQPHGGVRRSHPSEAVLGRRLRRWRGQEPEHLALLKGDEPDPGDRLGIAAGVVIIVVVVVAVVVIVAAAAFVLVVGVAS